MAVPAARPAARSPTTALLPLLALLCAVLASAAAEVRRGPAAAAARGRRRPVAPIPDVPRGGSTRAALRSEDDDEDEGSDDDEEERRRRIDDEAEKSRRALLKYRADQSVLLNLRSALLSEALARRGLPVATIRDVSTAEGDRPPEAVDWDCAMCTAEDPKTCLYSFDAEPDTKVVAPLGTTQWISLSALNRLRRTDPTKVEPMWHSRYSILKSWFSDESEFSLLQHVGMRGFLVSSVLLDLGGGAVLRALLLLAALSALVVAMPPLEYLVNRLLVSGALWSRWYSWHRIAHAALPFKLLVGQIAWKWAAGAFAKLEGGVRERVVDLECAILEECVPVTVGGGAVEDEAEEEDEDESFGEGGMTGSQEEDEEDVCDDFPEEDDYDESDW